MTLLPSYFHFASGHESCSDNYQFIFGFGSSGTGNGQFDGPTGITIDPTNGNVIVTEVGNDRVQVFNENGTFLFKFGSLGTGNGQFDGPNGVAVDSSGNIYVADSENDRVQKFNSAGTYQSQFGSFGTGDGQFNTPVGMAFDSSGNIFVTDYGNHRVQKFNSSGAYQSQFGSSGTADGQFSLPSHMEIDPATDNIFVAENTGARIQKFDSSGSFLAKTGGILSGITALGLGNQKIFFVTTPSDILYSYPFSLSAGTAESFGSTGSGNCQFAAAAIHDIAYASTTKRFYVADKGNDRIQVFLDLEIVSTSIGIARRLIENTLADTSPLIAGGLV